MEQRILLALVTLVFILGDGAIVRGDLDINWNWDDINSTTSYNSTKVRVELSESGNCTLHFNGTDYPNPIVLTTISWNFDNQANGNYSAINVTCEDASGNSTISTNAWWNVLYQPSDTTPPIILWDSDDINSTIFVNYADIAISASEAVISCNLNWNGTNESMVSVSSTSFYKHKSNLHSGNYTLRAYCNDTSNNTGYTTLAWVNVSYTFSDTESPVIILDSPPDNFASSNDDITLTYTATDNMAATMNCSLYLNDVIEYTNGQVSNNTVDSYEIQDLSEDTYDWFVRCWDGENVGASGSRRFIIDKTAPTIRLKDPDNDSTIHSGWEIDLSVDDDYEIDKVWWNDGGSNRTLSSPYDVDTDDWDSDGRYWLTVWVNDTLGNLRKSVFSFIVDDTSPDLAVYKSDIDLSQRILYEGDEVDIEVTVRNLGEEDAEDFVVTLRIDGKREAEVIISVDGNSKSKIIFDWVPDEDDRKIKIEVDSDDDIDESIEDNNEATKRVSVRSRLDDSEYHEYEEGNASTEENETSEDEENETDSKPLKTYIERKEMVVAISGAMEDGEDFIVVVVSLEGHPVVDAEVEYGNQEVKTGEDGKATLRGVVGSSKLTVKKSGYETITRQVSVLPNALEKTKEKTEPTGDVTTTDADKPGEIKLSHMIIVLFAVVCVVAFVFYRREKPYKRHESYAHHEPPTLHNQKPPGTSLDDLKNMIKGTGWE